MNILILEDEHTSRLLIKQLLAPFGNVDTAEDGREALMLFENAINENRKYDFICLDIMVPEMDGQEVLRKMRAIEEQNGFDRLGTRAKIVMITALHDADNVMTAFNEQCEGYIFKPFSRAKIEKTLQQLGLIDNN